MAAKIIVAILLSCVCAAYAGGLVAAPAVAGYAHAPFATYAPAPLATYAAAPIAAPVATYAAAPIAVASPVFVDNTHFSYGYANPFLNGRVDVARDGPIASHAYTFRAGTLFKCEY